MGLLDMMGGSPLGNGGQGGGFLSQQQGAVPPPPEQKSFWDKVKGGFDPEMAMPTLAAGLANMSHNKSLAPVMNQRLQYAMAKRQKDEELERLTAGVNKTADAIEAAGDKQTADFIRANPESGAAIAAAWQKQRMTPQENWEMVRGEDIGGQPGSLYRRNTQTGKVEGIGAGGTNVQVTNQLPPTVAKPEPGMEHVYDNNGNIVKAVPIPGGSVDLERQATADKKRNLRRTQQTAALTVVQDLNRGMTKFDDLTDLGNDFLSAQWRNATKDQAGTAANKLQNLLDSAASNIGIDQIMQMKLNSPTGGALGQIPFQQQQRLEQLLGTISVGMELPELKDNMRRIQNIYLDGAYGTRANRQAQLDKQAADPEAYAEGGPLRGDYLDPALNEEINSAYQGLSFDRFGRSFPMEEQPPGWDDARSDVPWEKLTDKQKENVWRNYSVITQGGRF